MRARRCCGIVAQGLEEAQARALAAELALEELGGWVLREDAIATVAEPEGLRSIELQARAVRLARRNGSPEVVAGRAIRLVAAATVGKQMLLEILLQSPFRRLRIDAERFDFRCLGRRMNYDARNNLRELARSVCALAPAALRSRGTASLLADRRSEPASYEALEDLEREERWLLTIG
ncbi:MAG: hypothetical protein HY554_16435 [Elusimicrobia bacterium]|nr:hypothetical protein [Elusimicrobiota bacterium]